MQTNRESLRRLMEEKGFNAETLANKAGISREAVYTHLGGRRTRMMGDTLLRLSAALACDPAVLVENTGVQEVTA